MTWTEALQMHEKRGHDEFVLTATLKDKWPVFIKNVCTELGCSHAEKEI